MKQVCSLSECDRLHYGHGYCQLHWQRWRRNGDPRKLVRAPAGSGSVSTQGYRVRWRDKKLCLEHRLVWEAIHGPIPEAHSIHHLNGDRLDNRIENLELLSASEHGKLHSPSPYANENCVECGTPAIARDFCKRHYHRWYRKHRKQTAT